jgi:hypothetical protein
VGLAASEQTELSHATEDTRTRAANQGDPGTRSQRLFEAGGMIPSL